MKKPRIHEGDSASLALWLTDNGFSPISTIRLSSLSCDGQTVAHDIEIPIDPKARASVKLPVPRTPDYEPGRVMSVSGQSVCSEKEFQAKGFIFRSSSSYDGDFIEIALNTWSFLRDLHGQENLWVSELELPGPIPFEGNLSVFASKTSILGQHFFQGAYGYFLIKNPLHKRSRNHWLLLFSTGSKLPNLERLSRDAMIFQYILGSRGLFGPLHHVSAEGTILGCIGWSSGICTPPNTHLLPPTRSDRAGWWHAELFRQMSLFERKHPRAIALPLELYLESIHGSFGGATLKVAVALEAVCQRYAIETPELKRNRLAVANQADWNGWINSKRDEILSFAATPSDRQTLLDRVRSAAGDDKGVVPRCFMHWKMWRGYMLSCIQIRNALAHHGQLNKKRKLNTTNTSRQRALLARTMFNCALAQLVSFRGPILDMRMLLRKGALRIRIKDVSPPSWWPMAEEVPRTALQHHQIGHYSRD